MGSRVGGWLILGIIAVFSDPARAQAPVPCSTGPSFPVDVTTYHNDPQRTGWNSHETALRPCNVDPRSFGLVTAVIDINGQIDAQPLVVTNQEVETGQGERKKYDVVVYVVTASNSIYAIDGTTGDILTERTLGIPVDQSKLPGMCGNNASSIGISSTPVIDPNSRTLYLVAYLWEENKPVYRIFALDLADLSLKVKPAPVIEASHDLADGSKYEFAAGHSRQRAGLVLANRNVYAAFASFCDFLPDVSRGWVLGWQIDSLKPLPQNQLNDRRLKTGSAHNFFLSSIWMSGYGVGADDGGAASDLYFITGNSDRAGPFQIDPSATLEESVVRMRGDLGGVVDYFTPADREYGVQRLDRGDVDFGSGGVLVVPGEQTGAVKHLAIAAGKAGQMYLIDRDHMGKYDSTGTNHVLDAVDIGKCWCGQSYFIGPDGTGRIVSSGGANLKVWKIATTPAPKLILDYASPVDLEAGGFQKGFFTAVSSDGEKPDTAIIWAVRRPTDQMTFAVTLYAFDAADGKLLYSAPAGTWRRYQQAGANIVPTIANGKVYVASDSELRIFGLGGQAPAAATAAAVRVRPALAAAANTYSGSIIRIEGTRLWLNSAQQGVLEVDAAKAQEEGLSVHLEPGEPVTVHGSRAGNTVQATSIYYGLSAP
jgi:hypothetical protein